MPWPRRKIAPSLHQPFTGLGRSPPDQRGQREHLSEASFMGDQVVSQQLIPGLDQGRQRHPQ